MQIEEDKKVDQADQTQTADAQESKLIVQDTIQRGQTTVEGSKDDNALISLPKNAQIERRGTQQVSKSQNLMEEKKVDDAMIFEPVKMPSFLKGVLIIEKSKYSYPD